MYKNCNYAIKVHLQANASNPCSMQITIKSYGTKAFLCQMGLKQGCNLSPLFANIYPVDLHSVLDENNQHGSVLVNSSVTFISWADNLMMLSLDKKSLQNCIHSFQAYSNIWKLEVSLRKPSVLFFPKETLNIVLCIHYIITEKQINMSHSLNI